MLQATTFHALHSKEDLQEALETSQQQDVVLYKHSNTCPISASARKEMQALAGDEDPAVFEVVVQEARDVSDEIAERFGIQHETPQAIVLKQGQPIFDASHHDVTADTIRTALAENGS